MFHVKSSKEMELYFKNILDDVKKIYSIAEECRKKGYDPIDSVEIPLAKDMADRVEGLVGPKGISNRIRELVAKLGKEPAALEIAKEIVEGKFGNENSKEKLAEQALRTALAIITEGIVAAPLEGIAHVDIKKNRDGSEYLAIYFAGPIRSAGGTAQALAVLVGDYVRKNMGLSKYMPSEDEIERYVEEVDLYQSEVGSFQYSPSAEEIRTAVKNIPIEITGEATDDVEVSGHRDLDRVETNQIRGGALLALVEGVLLKAPKILRHVDKLGIEGWDWLKELKGKKEEKKEGTEDNTKEKDLKGENNREDEEEEDSSYEDVEVEAITKFIGEVIAGRPVFAHPSKTGGFRLRYGRSRNTGFATDGFHPALMYLVDEFMAVGTQLKTERPGKATCVVPVDSIEPPIVKLKNGNVIKIDTIDKAIKYRDSVEEILFLGDILVNYGDFLENNHSILPSSWCEEWYEKILISKNIEYNKDFIKNPCHKKTVKFAIDTNTPLHPKYTYYWHDVTKEDIATLRNYILKGEVKLSRDHNRDVYLIPYDEKNKEHVKSKRILEVIGCCHNVIRMEGDSNIYKYIEIEEYYPLLYSLGYDIDNKRDRVKENSEDIENLLKKSKNSMHFINLLSPFEIRRKAYIYIGARMGRPEKAAARKMKPPVNSLFPIGNAGNVVRLINKAIEEGKTDTIEVSFGRCPNCGKISLYPKCPFCGTSVNLSGPNRIEAPLKEYWYNALENLGINKPGDVKCIKGMTSKDKIAEPLEKGILRAINNVYVFKDGTLRFDCTDVPITHFKPSEINISIEKLREMGYERDIYGNPIENENQIIELKVQDVIIPKACAEYFVKASNFIDDLLEKFYKRERFYNVKNKEDLIGHLVIGMAPHTSAGMVGRIIGYCNANVGYAHPYFHASKRRNCFPGNTRILININGEVKRITIEELYNLYDEKKEEYKNYAYLRRVSKDNNKIMVYSFNTLEHRVVLTDIEEVLKIPSQNHIIHIELQGGRFFETTPDHPVIVYLKESNKFIKKNAMEVNEKDLMLIPKLNLGKENNGNEMDNININGSFDIDALLKLIGYYLALGYMDNKYNDKNNNDNDKYSINDNKNNIIFSKCNNEIAKNIKKLIKSFGHFNIMEIKNNSEIILTIESDILDTLFKEIGIHSKENIKIKRIPSFVYKLSSKKIKLLLSSYFEGSKINKNLKYLKDKVLLMGDKDFLEDMDTLLNSKFNILGHFIEPYYENQKHGFLLDIDEYNKIISKDNDIPDTKDLDHNKNKTSNLNNNFGWVIPVKNKKIIKSTYNYIYSLNAKKYHNVIVNSNILTHQCDGDEDGIFLLLDAFLNFSKKYLPDKRGGQMDAPLVLTTLLDPKEVDGEVHNLDTLWEYPLEFYEKSLEMPSPKDIKELIETVEDRLGTPYQYEGIGYTHETTKIDNGPLVCAYKTLGTMLEKTEAQLAVAKKIRAADERDVAEKVIQSHFIPDLIGNLRAFSRQGVRCKCGAKYRRVPLKGVCTKCGSKLILTVSKGAVEKYMEVSQKMAEKYNASDYIKQRLELIKESIDNLFENDKNKQSKLGDFF
ncbi:MAG TPA: DNA-directed DNA polymerase II large subunit [Methanothermococcus okinawensis]|uniref:DNA polymerase II large subunit n=1 Tax=Methanothermococcus okinawensis TaxID=155863 RepID=A0A832YRT4_9EURY|nr:DNA-directed DNA polymerase II large subunit [Methanothermococcus okinawensis]